MNVIAMLLKGYADDSGLGGYSGLRYKKPFCNAFTGKML